MEENVILAVAVPTTTWDSLTIPPLPLGTVYAPVPSRYLVASFGSLGAYPCLDVLTSFVVISVKLRSDSAGWVAVGTPLVEIVLIHLLVTAARLWIPPRVEDDGLGRSAPTIVRILSAPVDPFGVARKLFAAWPLV
jgi:hypothetical protein